MTDTPSANPMPAIVSMERSEYGGDTYWSVTLAGGMSVCVETDELRSNRKFICNCIEQLGRAFEPTPQKTWSAMVDAALRGERERRHTRASNQAEDNLNRDAQQEEEGK